MTDTLTLQGFRGLNGDLVTRTYTVRSTSEDYKGSKIWNFTSGSYAKETGDCITVYCRHRTSIRRLMTQATIVTEAPRTARRAPRNVAPRTRKQVDNETRHQIDQAIRSAIRDAYFHYSRSTSMSEPTMTVGALVQHVSEFLFDRANAFTPRQRRNLVRRRAEAMRKQGKLTSSIANSVCGRYEARAYELPA